MAFTTSGWQWPVEQTATPALQSRNIFPSTSSTQTPEPRSATSLNEGRGYAGLTNWASASTIFCPFGPGSAVLISGRRGGASTLLDMIFSPCQKTDRESVKAMPWPRIYRPVLSTDSTDREASLRRGSRG